LNELALTLATHHALKITGESDVHVRGGVTNSLVVVVGDREFERRASTALQLTVWKCDLHCGGFG
jgi:hypothetical protein